MASSISHASFSSFPICVPSSSSSMFRKPCKPPSKPKRHHASKVACSNGSPNPNPNSKNNPTNRRDILIGLGGLYGAASTLNTSGSAFATGGPLSPPDPGNCGLATKVPSPGSDYCCPPFFTDYQLPPIENNTPPRIRQPAHSVSSSYENKYRTAVWKMKNLPQDDPRNFMQQAMIHCAYCDGGYKQKGFPDYNLDVHASWLFFPFHRWYLYFYERILGKLIDDPTFALPFWNWDHPNGMKMPSIYTHDQNSPLYDRFRDPSHVYAFMDLNYDPKKDHSRGFAISSSEIEKNNKCTVHGAVVEKPYAENFLGQPYRAGDQHTPGFGSLETVHNTIHKWIGHPNQPNGEDMGNFYSAARDPIFFAHHSNVDRMWNIWKTGLSPSDRRYDHNDPDWLETSFYFYDEEKNYVRVKVKDCLDPRKMGYDYKYVDIPWASENCRKPKYQTLPAPIGKQQLKAITLKTLGFPLTLDSIQRTAVKRPTPGNDEDRKYEVLVIDVEYDRTVGLRFDVFINDQGDDEIQPQDSEFAGSFVTLPHSSHSDHQNNTTPATFRLPITNLLKDLEVKDDDETIAVTLAPRYGEKPVTIKDIKILKFDVPTVEGG